MLLTTLPFLADVAFDPYYESPVRPVEFSDGIDFELLLVAGIIVVIIGLLIALLIVSISANAKNRKILKLLNEMSLRGQAPYQNIPPTPTVPMQPYDQTSYRNDQQGSPPRSVR